MGDYVTLLAQFYSPPLGVFAVTVFQVQNPLPVAMHSHNVDHGGGFRVHLQAR